MVTDLDRITELYETVDAKDATPFVLIWPPSGHLRVVSGAHSVEVSHGLDRVPTATFRLENPPSDFLAYFTRVFIGFGFNGVYLQDFTGLVLNVNRDETGCTVECIGTSWPLERFRKVVVTLNNILSSDAVENLLTAAGVAQSVSLPAWTIGTVVPQTLEFQTYAEAIRKIIEPEGAHWWEDASGIVHVRVVELAPSLTVVRNYFSMQLNGLAESYPTGITTGRPRLRSASRTQAVNEVKNQIFVRGATIDEEQPDGSVVSSDVESSGSAPSPYVLFPDGSQDYNDFLFSNELIDTQAKADEVVVRYLQILNQLQERVSISVDGDPRLSLATTVGIEDPAYTELTGRWILESYQTRIDQGEFASSLNLRTGAASTNVAPVASFSVTIDREVMTDRVYAIVTFDASASYDQDGTIVAYAWSDNQTPQIVTGSDPIFTIRIDPATVVEPWIVQLDVTDDSGSISSVSQAVDIDADSPTTNIPAFFVAFDSHFSASPDGGQSWNDQAGAGVISVDAAPSILDRPGYAVFGTSAGSLYHTTDYCATAPTLRLSGAGSPFVDIHWDVITGTTQVVWAITQDGRVYISIDLGLSWLLFDNLATRFGSGVRLNRIDSFRSGGQTFLRVYGGHTVAGKRMPLIAYRSLAGSSWATVPISGDLLSDLGASPPPDLYVADGAYKEIGELAIILNSATFQPAVYYTFFWGGGNFTRATGLPAKSQGRWIEPDRELGKFVFQFEDRQVYLGDVTGGVMAVTAAASALDLNESPNYGLYLGRSMPGLAGVYLVAGESGLSDGTLYKTFDRFATIGKLRPATGFPAALAGQNAEMVAVGPPGAPALTLLVQQGPTFSTVLETYPRRVAKLTSNWAAISDPASVSQERVYFLSRVGAYLYRLLSLATDPLERVGQLQRSTDNGVTWADVGPTPQIAGNKRWGVSNLCAAADGVLFLVTGPLGTASSDGAYNFPRIYKSIDAGATWSQIYEDTTTHGASHKRTMMDICAHPNDKNKLYVHGDRRDNGTTITWHSFDAGVSWTPLTTDMGFSSTGRACAMLNSGRVIAVRATTVYTLETPYTTATSVGTPVPTSVFQLLRTASDILFLCGLAGVSSPIVARSTDSGSTWVTVADDSTMNLVSHFRGIHYDTASDKLFIATQTDDPSQRVYELSAATQVTVGALRDITLNLDAIFPEGAATGSICLRGIAV